MKQLAYVLTFLCACVVSGAALADPAAGKSPDEKRAQVELRLKQLRSELLRKDVGLDPSKASVAEKVLERYAAERKKLSGERHAARRTLAKLLEADSTDQPAYTKAIRAARSSHAKLNALRDREFEELSRLMTPKQQAKFLAAVRRMQQKLGTLLKSYRADED